MKMKALAFDQLDHAPEWNKQKMPLSLSPCLFMCCRSRSLNEFRVKSTAAQTRPFSYDKPIQLRFFFCFISQFSPTLSPDWHKSRKRSASETICNVIKLTFQSRFCAKYRINFVLDIWRILLESNYHWISQSLRLHSDERERERKKTNGMKHRSKKTKFHQHSTRSVVVLVGVVKRMTSLMELTVEIMLLYMSLSSSSLNWLHAFARIQMCHLNNFVDFALFGCRARPVSYTPGLSLSRSLALSLENKPRIAHTLWVCVHFSTLANTLP